MFQVTTVFPKSLRLRMHTMDCRNRSHGTQSMEVLHEHVLHLQGSIDVELDFALYHQLY